MEVTGIARRDRKKIFRLVEKKKKADDQWWKSVWPHQCFNSEEQISQGEEGVNVNAWFNFLNDITQLDPWMMAMAVIIRSMLPAGRPWPNFAHILALPVTSAKYQRKWKQVWFKSQSYKSMPVSFELKPVLWCCCLKLSINLLQEHSETKLFMFFGLLKRISDIAPTLTLSTSLVFNFGLGNSKISIVIKT